MHAHVHHLVCWVPHLQFLQELEFTLDLSGSVGIVPESVDENLEHRYTPPPQRLGGTSYVGVLEAFVQN